MKSDDVAALILHQDWDFVKGKTREDDSFFGIVRLGELELKRFSISRADYRADRCAPCESSMKRMRDEIAKVLRSEYGE